MKQAARYILTEVLAEHGMPPGRSPASISVIGTRKVVGSLQNLDETDRHQEKGRKLLGLLLLPFSQVSSRTCAVLVKTGIIGCMSL